MPQLVINVPDDQLDFITTLLTKLDVEVQKQEELSDELKQLLDRGIAEYEANPTSARPWKDVKRDLLAKYGK